MLGDQPDVLFRAVKLHRFHAGQTIGKAKLHIVLLNHLTEEESSNSESLHNHSSRIFCSLPWGDLEIAGSTVTNEWNCTVSPYQNRLNEVHSSIGVCRNVGQFYKGGGCETLCKSNMFFSSTSQCEVSHNR